MLEPDLDGKPGARKIKANLWPDAGFVDSDSVRIFSELAGAKTLEQDSYTGETTDIRFVDAIAKGMDRQMELDDRIIILGEDVHRLKGGTNGATKGPPDKYDGRSAWNPN